MKEFTIRKRDFMQAEPSERVWFTIFAHMHNNGEVPRKSLLARFHYWYVAIPVFLFFMFGSYLVFFSQSQLEREITQTQTAMDELISITDTEVF